MEETRWKGEKAQGTWRGKLGIDVVGANSRVTQGGRGKGGAARAVEDRLSLVEGVKSQKAGGDRRNGVNRSS